MASSIWEEFKNLFKTDDQIESERQKKIDEALKAENSVVDKLKEIEKKYNDSLPKEDEIDIDSVFPKDSGLKEIEYTPRTDEDIVEAAKKSVGYDKQSEVNKLDQRYQNAIDALTENKQTAKDTLKQNYDNLEKLYKQLRENANDDALKRGVARSSIASGKMDALDASHLKSASDAENAYAATLAGINSDISKLERDKDTALGQLDLKYAVELDEKINQLKSERDKTVEKYEKYNNDVRQKMQAFETDRQKKISDYLKKAESAKLEKEKNQREYEAKYGYSGEKLDNYTERYQTAYDFYSSLSPDIAADALKASPNMKYYLGELYYKLLSSLQAKDTSTKKHF